MWKWVVVASIACSTHLSAEIKVLALSGSTRDDSVNKKLVNEAADFARQAGAKVTVINLKDYAMPFYDGDLETKEGMPPKAKEFRQLMMQNDVILIASPEYNGSLAAVLKNVIDWASRDEKGAPSRDAFKGKKFVIMSASPSPSGGTRGLEHLKTIIENIGGTVVAPQVAVPNAYEAFDAQGHLKDPKLKAELQKQVNGAVH